MDSKGAQTLRARLEQQEHWRQAEAVERGEQPATDPDVWDLEELGEAFRGYGIREEHREQVDGRPALVIQRLTKRLVGGWWTTAYEFERIRWL
jgi:hypothetical protein